MSDLRQLTFQEFIDMLAKTFPTQTWWTCLANADGDDNYLTTFVAKNKLARLTYSRNCDCHFMITVLNSGSSPRHLSFGSSSMEQIKWQLRDYAKACASLSQELC